MPQLNIYEDLKYYRSTTLLSFYYVRPGSDAVLFMCRTKLNKFDFGATLARHVIQTAHRMSRLS